MAKRTVLNTGLGYPPANKRRIKCVDGYCRGCVYLARTGDGSDWCDYIGITGHKRPCPAGKGCTEKKVAKRKREGIVIT